MKKILLCFVALLFASQSYGWNRAGHLVIGEIAYEHLSPVAKRASLQLLNHFSKYYPYSRSFYVSSAWADDLKGHEVLAFNSWHYIDTPYNPDHLQVSRQHSPNVVWAIDQAIDVLQSKRTNKFEKAFFLRFLIHCVGDCHQPLHCADYYSKQYPQGDEGGNLFPVNSQYGDNLHHVWDAGFGLLLKAHWLHNDVKKLANKIQRDYPETYFEKGSEKITDLTAQDWANESYQYAIKDAYDGVKTNEDLDDDVNYINRNRDICEGRIALAGYRLAALLNRIFVEQHGF